MLSLNNREEESRLIPHYTNQWWASYFLQVTSYKLQLFGKKVTKLQLQLQVTITWQKSN